ncbi:MAG: double-strand break repair protein AddB, partial [Alphaproteobacteria bacterium]
DGAGALGGFLDDLEARLSPLIQAMQAASASLGDLLQAHIEAAEALAASADESGQARLWAGDAGEATANFVAELSLACEDFPAIPPAQYPALLQALMAGRVVRPRYGSHPRLNIWGLLEARLQRADVMILGSLNEGTWPAEAQADPWMSRPMRAEFGLPLPERRIGLSAHDFVQSMGAPEIVLTRALRVEGTPSVPSRWLLRLDAVLHALSGTDPDPKDTKEKVTPAYFYLTGSQMLDWHRDLYVPKGPPEPTDAPAPRPPLSARPRRLSVTQIETLMRDPYALYANKVLGLRALDPIDADPGAADRGLFIHAALEEFVRAYSGGDLPGEARQKLLVFGRQAFGKALSLPGVWAFWWPRFERIAAWFLKLEAARRPDIARSHVEVRGERVLKAPGGDFLLTATADRIDEMADASLVILDYKTGALPSKKEIAAGFAPQLPLEAAIAAGGGFEGIAAAAVGELAFWHLPGGTPPGKIYPLKDPVALAAEALRGLAALISCFDDEAMPYMARPRPSAAPRYSDYVHLERIAEWSAAAGEEDG